MIQLKALIKNIFFGIVFLLAGSDFVFAHTAIPVDSSKVAVRKPSAEKQKEIFSDADYTFDKQGRPPVSWWDRFKTWLQRQIDELFSTQAGVTFLFAFKWALIAGAIVLIIFLLLKTDIRFLFYKKSKSNEIHFSEITENIHEIDFEKQIEEAVSKKNFRRAIRLSFLKILKLLSDKKLIDWKPDKTNYDFYLELQQQNFKNNFRAMSVLYDYVWYGDFSLTENDFKAAAQQFKKFNDHLQN